MIFNFKIAFFLSHNPLNNLGNLYEFYSNDKRLSVCSHTKGEDEGNKKKKIIVERKGDWVCIKCKNLNFSFRIVCNRCKITKEENDKISEEHMKAIQEFSKKNENCDILANKNDLCFLKVKNKFEQQNYQQQPSILNYFSNENKMEKPF